MLLGPSLLLHGPVKAMFQRLLETCSSEVFAFLTGFCLPRSFLFLQGSILNHIFPYPNGKLISYLFIIFLYTNSSWTGLSLPMGSWTPSGWEIAASGLYTESPRMQLVTFFSGSPWHHGSGMLCQLLLQRDSWASPCFSSYHSQPWLASITLGQPLFWEDWNSLLPCVLPTSSKLSTGSYCTAMTFPCSKSLNDTID